MRTRVELARRRARIARIEAKRPAAPIARITYAPRADSLDSLAELVLELLDARAHSGQG